MTGPLRLLSILVHGKAGNESVRAKAPYRQPLPSILEKLVMSEGSVSPYYHPSPPPDSLSAWCDMTHPNFGIIDVTSN